MKNSAMAAEKAWLKAAAQEICHIKNESVDHETDPILGKKTFWYHNPGPYATPDSIDRTIKRYNADGTYREDAFENLYATYRYRHVAYSLLRGHDLKAIEPKNRENNQLNQQTLDHYVSRLRVAVEEASSEADVRPLS